MSRQCGALSAQAHGTQHREVAKGGGRSQKQRLVCREA